VPPELKFTARYGNILLGALAQGTMGRNVSSNDADGTATLDFTNAPVNRMLGSQPSASNMENDALLKNLAGLTYWQAAKTLVNQLIQGPDSQTYTLFTTIAAIFQTDDNLIDGENGVAMEIFRSATKAGLPADGRFVNAVLRCFGSDIDAAIDAWKSEVRRACLAHENRVRFQPVSPSRRNGKNLLAAYHGLIYVAGKALRPEVALRLVYAMTKEGLAVGETSLNCYMAGKRRAVQPNTTSTKNGVGQRLRKLLNMMDAYE
jgi:hypothetical protein